MNRLAHPDGSLADLTMMSSSPDSLVDKEKEMLVVESIAEEKKKEEEEDSIHGESQHCSMATDPEIPSEESSGTMLLLFLRVVCVDRVCGLCGVCGQGLWFVWVRWVWFMWAGCVYYVWAGCVLVGYVCVHACVVRVCENCVSGLCGRGV